MVRLSAFIDGVGLIGPGLPSWGEAGAVLAGRAPFARAVTPDPDATILPGPERRRVGRAVRLAIAVGGAALEHTGASAEALLTVFASSGADGENCHALCEKLASADRALSPTRFHNSVHNAAAGYWGIATQSMAGSIAVSAHDASFSAGLLESVALVATAREPVLLIACDTQYPEPLHSKRPVLDCFGVGLLLRPSANARSLASVCVELSEGVADTLEDVELERLRLGVPAARALPVLRRLARREWGVSRLEYLDPVALQVEVRPC